MKKVFLFTLAAVLQNCTGIATWESVAPLEVETFSDILLDGDAADGVHAPDATLETGAFLWGISGQTLYRLWVTRAQWTAESLGVLPEDWNVGGLAVDSADSQMLYVLVFDEALGVQRIFRGTGRSAWEVFSSFKLPSKTEAGTQVLRLPIRGLSMQDNHLVFLSEYVEEDSATVLRSVLETYQLPLDRKTLTPERISVSAAELFSPPKGEASPGYFKISDSACTRGFTRRAYALNQLNEERSCLTHPMSVGSLPAALRHGSKTQQAGPKNTLTKMLTEATAVTAVPNSRLLALWRAQGLELYDAWLEKTPRESLARLDRHLPTFSMNGAVSEKPALHLLAGFDASSAACDMPSTHAFWGALNSLLQTGTQGVGASAKVLMRDQRSVAPGFRCPCGFLSQTQTFLKKNEGNAEEWVVGEVNAAVVEEARILGCALPMEVSQ